MSKPVKVKSRNEFATNKVFRLYFDSIEDNKNNLKEDNYLVIETHNSLNDFTGVSVLPVIDNSVLLIKIYRHAIKKEIFEVPRGFVENNDKSIKFSALRELREEANLDCRDSDIVFIHGMYPEPGILRAKIALFIAKNCFNLNKNNFEEKEFGHKTFKLFSKNDVIKLLDHPEKFDTTTYILLKHWYKSS